MNLNDYPQVVVEEAPGYATFDGWLVTKFPAVDGRGELAVVAYLWKEKIEIDVFSHRYVKEMS